MEKTLDITLDELLNKLGKTKEDLVMSLNNLQQYVEPQEHGDLKYVYLGHDISDDEAKEIIKVFERKYDSNIDENTQWDYMIEQFVKRRGAK